jgi:predicted SAM-dependent methyltransferase
MKRLLRKNAIAYRFAKNIRRAYRRAVGASRLRRLEWQRTKRIVVGASGQFGKGWVPTDVELLDLLDPDGWERHLQPGSLDAILAEHVWEHLTEEEGVAAARTCFKYLSTDGYLRVAVPDGLHTASAYIEWVKIGGVGPGADDHKVLYTYKTIREVFERAQFEVVLYEYFDEEGRFHYKEWDPGDGMIRRSKRFDERNENGRLDYTSIVLDARKHKPSEDGLLMMG